MLKVILWNAESIKVCIYPSGSRGRRLWGFGWGASGGKTERLRGESGRPSGFPCRAQAAVVFVTGLSASFVCGPSDAACGEDVPRVEVSEPYGVSRSRRPPQPIGGQPEGKDLQGGGELRGIIEGGSLYG